MIAPFFIFIATGTPAASLAIAATVPLVATVSGTAISRPVCSTALFSWSWGGRYFWTWRLVRFPYLHIAEGIKPVARSARRCFGFRRGWYGWPCRSIYSLCCLPCHFIRRGWRRFRRHFLSSGLLHAIGASYFFSICRLKPLATGDAAHFNLAHAQTPLFSVKN